MSMSLFAVWVILTLAVLVYVTAWFELAQYLDRIDAVDSAWGLGFVYVAMLSILLQFQYDSLTLTAGFLVALWGLRLFWHITARNLSKDEDGRYAAYRTRWGKSLWRKVFTNIYLVQGALILIISTPIVAIAASPGRAWTLPVKLGFLIWITGIGFETLADYQLRHFLKSKPRKHTIMQTGLWRYSRHPNYFGEVVTWFGAAVVAAGVGQWWGFIGFATITFLILKVSGIPPTEKRHEHDKAYQAYSRKTSVFLPLPPKQS